MEAPVWMWLPGVCTPVCCATFVLSSGIGSFRYLPSYLEDSGAMAIDPINLPLNKEVKTETNNNGIFGVLFDSDNFSLYKSIIYQHYHVQRGDWLSLLGQTARFAVGAVVVGDAWNQIPSSTLELEVFLFALAHARDDESAATIAARCMGYNMIIHDVPRVRVTVEINGQVWLAKIDDCPGRSRRVLREFAAMRLAHAFHVDAAEVLFRRAGRFDVLLVKRFDCFKTSGNTLQRKPYLSASTVLKASDRKGLRNEERQSYEAIANRGDEMALSSSCSSSTRRELWRRLVVNVACGNGDDHTLNHGFIFHSSGWKLAPAFDISPSSQYSGRQSLNLVEGGTRNASYEALLLAAEVFGWERQEAMQFIDYCTDRSSFYWDVALEEVGELTLDVFRPKPSMWLARSLASKCSPGAGHSS